MTDEERQQQLTAKARVTAALAAADIDRYQLHTVDARLYAYVRQVAGNPADHCLWEQLAVERFLGMCAHATGSTSAR